MKLDAMKRLFSGLLDRVRYFNSPGEFDGLVQLSETGLKLVSVAEALSSVLSEDGVKEYLSAYVMGVELIDRFAALESE